LQVSSETIKGEPKDKKTKNECVEVKESVSRRKRLGAQLSPDVHQTQRKLNLNQVDLKWRSRGIGQTKKGSRKDQENEVPQKIASQIIKKALMHFLGFQEIVVSCNAKLMRELCIFYIFFFFFASVCFEFELSTEIQAPVQPTAYLSV
jgi:hypothetical protein